MNKIQYLNALGITYWQKRPLPVAPIKQEQETLSPQQENLHPLTENSLQNTSTSLTTLAQKISTCTACSLAKSRTQVVVGSGNHQARLFIVGEAPGEKEDLKGLPFVGKSGDLLDAMLLAVQLKREDIYIANIIKCRPPDNRNPLPEEAKACMGFLHQQISLVSPTLIVTMGRIAAQYLLNNPSPIGHLRGSIHSLASYEIPVIVTYHPAYLLRKPSEKARAWEDWKSIQSYLSTNK